MLYLSWWLFDLRHLPLEFPGSWVEPDLNAKMRTSGRLAPINIPWGRSSLLAQRLVLSAPTTEAQAWPGNQGPESFTTWERKSKEQQTDNRREITQNKK